MLSFMRCYTEILWTILTILQSLFLLNATTEVAITLTVLLKFRMALPFPFLQVKQ